MGRGGGAVSVNATRAEFWGGFWCCRRGGWSLPEVTPPGPSHLGSPPTTGPGGPITAVPRQRGGSRSSAWAVPPRCAGGGCWCVQPYNRRVAGARRRGGAERTAPLGEGCPRQPPVTPRALWRSPRLPLSAPPQRSAPHSLVGLASSGCLLVRMRASRALPALIGHNGRKNSVRSRPMGARRWLRAEGREGRGEDGGMSPRGRAALIGPVARGPAL